MERGSEGSELGKGAAWKSPTWSLARLRVLEPIVLLRPVSLPVPVVIGDWKLLLEVTMDDVLRGLSNYYQISIKDLVKL